MRTHADLREVTARAIIFNGLPIIAVGQFGQENDLQDTRLYWCKDTKKGFEKGCELSEYVRGKLTQNDTNKILTALTYQLAKEDEALWENWAASRWEDQQYARYGTLPY